jgi:hypothetical protein
MANFGAGVYSRGSSGSATVTTTNTTFSGNTARFGGGVFNDGAFGNATLTTTHTTFSGNMANFGAGVYSDGTSGSATATFTATLLAGSSPTHCVGVGNAPFTSNGFNLADASGASCSLTQPSDLLVADAGLAPLAHNGGPTQTHALLPTSPAIDAIPANACSLPTDQRGVARPQDGDANGAPACDVGAFERIGTLLRGTSLKPFPGWNKVVAGAPVYVYFSYDGNTRTDILASATVGVIACTTGQPVGGTQPAMSGGLYWQANYGRYLYIWKTASNWPAGCRQLVLRFVDGSELRLNVEIVKHRR